MTFSKAAQVDDFLKDLLYEVKKIDTKGLPGPAMTMRGSSDVCGDIYRIYVGKQFPEDVQQGLFIHEAGHIIFGHMKNHNLKNSINKMKVKAAYPKVSKRFKDAAEFEKYFDKFIDNVCSDFEVNSKLMTYDEWNYLDKTITNGKGGGFHPSDYGYPEGLDYNSYINLFLSDPESFFQKMKEKMQNSQGGDGESSGQDDTPDPFQNDPDMQNQNGNGKGNGQGQSGNNQKNQQNNNSSGNGQQKDSQQSQNGNGGGSGQQQDNQQNNKSDGKGSGTGKNKSVDTKKKKSENGGSGNNGEKSKLPDNWIFSKNELEKLEKEVNSHDEDQIKQALKTIGEIAAKLGKSKGYGTEAEEIPLEICLSFGELEKKIQKNLTNKETFCKRDIMYNYNRNRTGTSVLVPAVRKESRYKKATIYTIVDISGSVDSELVAAFAQSFRKIAKKLGAGSRIIFCNEQVKADFGQKDQIRAFAGGGTEIANGIAYVKKNYNPTGSDVVYIVSDFEDSMERWNDVLDTMNCKKKGIIWSDDEESMKKMIQDSHLETITGFMV